MHGDHSVRFTEQSNQLPQLPSPSEEPLQRAGAKRGLVHPGAPFRLPVSSQLLLIVLAVLHCKCLVQSPSQLFKRAAKIYLTSFPRSLSPSPLSLQFSVCHLDLLLLRFLPMVSTDNHNCHHEDHQNTSRPDGHGQEVDF